METYTDGTGRRWMGLRLLADGLVIAWVVLWIVLGLTVDRRMHQLNAVSHSIRVAATTVDQTAEAIGPLADLPLVGGRIREAVARIRLGAAQANIDAKRTRSSIDGLARLLGLAVALAPTVPIAAGYAAYRVIEARRRRRARSAILPPSNGPPAPPERDATRAVPAHQAAVTG